MSNITFISDFPFSRYVKNRDVIFANYYEEPSMIRRIIQLLKVPIKNKVNNEWLHIVKNSKSIILFDTLLDYGKEIEIIETNCHPDCRLIFYAWNPIKYSPSFNRLNNRWERHTFSRKDSIAYNIGYSGPFYFVNPNMNDVFIKRDGLFIGLEKSRKDILGSIKDLYLLSGFTPDIQIVNNIKALFGKKYSFYKSYEEVCQLIFESRSIIEVLQPGQDGVSLRTMESLFFQKKLITNNFSIIENEFYDPQNIFIYGKDNPSRFREFLLTPYKRLNPDIVNQYKFENWLNRILNL